MPFAGDVVGIGIDVVSWERIKRLLKAHSPEAFDRILTPDERKSFQESFDPVQRLARLLAAKEASFKAGSGSWMGDEGFRQIEITFKDPNRFQASNSSQSEFGIETEGNFFEAPEGIGALAFAKRGQDR